MHLLEPDAHLPVCDYTLLEYENGLGILKETKLDPCHIHCVVPEHPDAGLGFVAE